MTVQEFDAIKWKSGMCISIDNITVDIISVDFQNREIAYEDEQGLIWVDCEFVTLKQQ